MKQRFVWSFFALLSFVVGSPLGWSQQAPTNVPFMNASTHWGIYFARTVGSEVKASYSLGEIVQRRNEAGSKTRLAVLNAVQTTFYPLIRFAVGAKITGKVNIASELSKALNTFTIELKKNLQDLDPSEASRFQLLIAPRLSDELRRRNSEDKDLLRPLYSEDKFTVFEPMPEADSAFKPARHVINSEVRQAMSFLYEENRLASPDKPVFLMLMLTVDLKPKAQMDDSKISLQVGIGMPTGKQIDFPNESPDAKFSHFVLPDTPKGNVAVIGGARGAVVESYPMAMGTIISSFDESKPLSMYVEFGPDGTYDGESGHWKIPDNANFNKFLPKLRGKLLQVPIGSKTIKVGALGLGIDINVCNMQMNLERLEVESIQNYVSLGSTLAPAVKLAKLNLADVNEQFKTEINNTIKTQIEEQKKALAEKLKGKAEGKAEQAAKEYLAKHADGKGPSADAASFLFKEVFEVGE